MTTTSQRRVQEILNLPKFKDNEQQSFFVELQRQWRLMASVVNQNINYYEQTTEPIISINSVALWKDTANSKYYFIINFGGTQSKIYCDGSGDAVEPGATVVTETTYGQSDAVGSQLNFSRVDHTHGTPNVPDHDDLTGLTDDDHTQYVHVNGTRDINYNTGDFQIGDVTGGNYTQFEADGTIEFVGDATVWDDLRIVPGSFDRPGVSDPELVVYAVGGGGVNSYLWEFGKNDIASFTCQIPHLYKTGSDIYVHIHWTPGANGVAENGNTVGWKIDYSWANINGTFGEMSTLDLSDACDGTNHKHQMTPDVAITGTGKGISSMLICNIKRTDTGADDTWAGSGTGNLPFLLEIDFHFEIDTLGSRDKSDK